jgi:Holliday junction resolvase
MREASIERKVVDYCREHGILCYKFVSPNQRGVPDRILVLPGGQVIFVELKAPTGSCTKLQLHEQKKLTDHNAEVWVVNNFETFKARMDIRCET